MEKKRKEKKVDRRKEEERIHRLLQDPFVFLYARLMNRLETLKRALEGYEQPEISPVVLLEQLRPINLNRWLSPKLPRKEELQKREWPYLFLFLFFNRKDKIKKLIDSDRIISFGPV